ncbi:MAG: hypothetical protein ACI30Y_02860 [Candidatus Limisoma sp.]
MNYSYLKSSCATSFSAQRKSSVGILQCLKSEIELMNDSNHDVTLPEIDARWVERFARDRNVLIMGHSSEVTTLIYLDSIENSVVDHANRDLIKSLGL